MSFLLTKNVAAKAVIMVRPAIDLLIQTKVFKRGDLHIVIVDPTVLRENMCEDHWIVNVILYECSIGNPGDWETAYDKIARDKCYLSWLHGVPTQVLQARMPYLLDAGDTVYYGSAVRDGLVVACSGVQPYFDQMVSEWVLEACRALCIQGRESLEAYCKDGFIPAEE